MESNILHQILYLRMSLEKPLLVVRGHRIYANNFRNSGDVRRPQSGSDSITGTFVDDIDCECKSLSPDFISVLVARLARADLVLKVEKLCRSSVDH